MPGNDHIQERLEIATTIPYWTKKCRTKLTTFFRGDENFVQRKSFVRRKFCLKIKFYVFAGFDRFSTLQIWNINIGLPSDIKP